MKLNTLIVPAVVLLTMAAGSTPAQADQHVRHGSAVARGSAPHARGAAPHGGPRVVAPRHQNERPRVIVGGSPYRGHAYPRYIGRPHVVRPYGYRGYGYRPYAYTFRPRLSIGLGIYLGYPVPYPYYDEYSYPTPAYGYPAPGTVSVAPPEGGYGGVSLDITPNDAAVTVDGTLAGTVDDFNDPSHPLSLPVGVHHMEVRSPGYATLVFDVDIAAGQVLPYQGDLQQR